MEEHDDDSSTGSSGGTSAESAPANTGAWAAVEIVCRSHRIEIGKTVDRAPNSCRRRFAFEEANLKVKANDTIDEPAKRALIEGALSQASVNSEINQRRNR